MSKNILSKSSFIRGIQCHKSLYLYKNRYFLKDPLPPEQLAKFKRGTNVGVLARQLFPGGIDCSPSTPFQYSRSVLQTAALVESNFPAIYEAAFSHDSVLIALDILVQKEDRWHAYEVKSSVSISDSYLMDAALQYYVITGSGLEIASFSIITMNKDYVKSGDINLNQLFKIEDVTEYVIKQQDFIREEIQKQLKVVALPSSPAIEPGLHCHRPYPCDFYRHCHKRFPANSVLNWQWLSLEEKYDLVRKKKFVAESIPENYFDDAAKRMKLTAHKQNLPITELEKGKEMIGHPVYPLMFCKAYYSFPAVPLIDGTTPYTQLPILLSVAEMNTRNNGALIINHHYFDESESKKEISDRLLNIFNVGAKTIYVYNDSYLMHSIENNQGYDYAAIKCSIVDLAGLILQGCYYHPSTNGEMDLMQWRGVLKIDEPDATEIFSKDGYVAIDYANLTNDEAGIRQYRAKAEKSATCHLRMMQSLLDMFQ